jgi:uncharacterized protein YkwD
MVYGFEGYQYYRNALRLAVWVIIPFFAVLFTYYHNSPLTIFNAEISKIWLLALFACTFISLYYNRFNISHAVKIFIIILTTIIVTISLTGAIIPDTQYDWGVTPLFNTGGTSQNYNVFQIPSATPTIFKSTIIPTYSIGYTSMEDSKKYIDYVNTLRRNAGISALQFDSRVYNIAMARVNDMDAYGYMDHTNPQTGSCPDSIKNKYGLSSDEYVAENAFGFDAGGHYSTGLEKEAIDSWMTSRGHRYNLLYPHTAGAVACSSGGHCVFLGLNNDRFGEGCYTGTQG